MAGKALGIDGELAIELVEGESGRIHDLFLPGLLEAVAEVFPAIRLRFPARVEPALNLCGGAVLQMPQPNALRGDYAEMMRPGGIGWPVELRPMPEETRFTGIGDVVARQVRGADLRSLRRVFGREAGQVGGCQIVLQMRGPDDVIASRHPGQKSARLVDVEFIGIQPAPPIAGRGLVAKLAKNLPAQGIVERAAVAERRDDLGMRAGDFIDRVPRGVGAPIVEDVNAVAPAQAFLKEVAQNVVFILNEANAVDAHAEEKCCESAAVNAALQRGVPPRRTRSSDRPVGNWRVRPDRIGE
jgi:hypothetical protein